MDVRIRDERLSKPPRPIDGHAVEAIHLRCVERVQLDRIEQIGMSFEKMTQTAAGRVVGMGRNHQTGRLRSPELRHVFEVSDALSCGIKIEQQHVFVLDRPFHSGNERDAPGSGIVGKVAHVEPAIVQRNGQDVIPERGRAVD
jgi:hypothetical protein